MEGQISKHSRICSSDMRLIDYPITQEQKVYIWDKELCNGAEWNDFLKCVEEKSKENAKLKKQLAITEKSLELAVETMRYELGREAIKNLYKDAIKNLKDNLNMKFDTEMCEWFIEQAKEMLDNE